METHWSAHLTLSIVHFMIFPETMKGEGPVLDTVRRIAEDAFFAGIEITWIKDAAVRKEVKSLLEAAGVPAAFGAQPDPADPEAGPELRGCGDAGPGGGGDEGLTSRRQPKWNSRGWRR